MSAETADLLIEIGCEELPPKSLLALTNDFASMIKSHLIEESFFMFSDVEIFATPRRIAAIFKNIPIKRSGGKITQWGPPENIAFDKAGNPTPAAFGFAKKYGVAFDQLEKKEGKLFFSYTEKDCYVKNVVGHILIDVLHRLPIAKRMSWGTQKREFARPIHWIVVLLNDEIISKTIFDLMPNRITYGHRFHHPNAIKIKHPNEYINALRKAFVEPDFNIRRESIRTQVIAAAEKMGGVVHIDESLLEEVTALVEWPVALVGQFDKQFLNVPHEALVSTMTDNQKYFPVFDAATGNMLPQFIFITNIESKDPAQIIAGNEKVIRPRFSDAKFFFEQDKKVTLESRLPNLNKVIFHPKLGTLSDKSVRLVALSREIANMLETHQQDGLPEKSAMLCKADLLTSMVFEFPELQGTMGYYYALHDGEPEAVAIALKEHYLPRFADDVLPESQLGQILALADRFDTIAGIFAIGQAPTGDKDPFALRRAALGILRILIQKELACDMKILVEKALSLYSDAVCKNKTEVTEQIMEFLFDRLRSHYLRISSTAAEYSNYLEFFTAVRFTQPVVTHPYDFDLRMQALSQFWNLPQAKALAAANKRASNILNKEQPLANQLKVNPSLLTEVAEKNLFEKLEQISNKVTALANQQIYSEALINLAALREHVDAFFDHVMVNVEDEALRNNRFALLQKLRALFIQIADISLIPVTHDSKP